MEVGLDLVRRGSQIDDLFVHQVRFNRGEADTVQTLNFVQFLKQHQKSFVGTCAKITGIDAGYHHFAVPFAYQLLCVSYDRVDGGAPALATRHRYGTEGALIAASVLNLEKCTGQIGRASCRDGVRNV